MFFSVVGYVTLDHFQCNTAIIVNRCFRFLGKLCLTISVLSACLLSICRSSLSSNPKANELADAFINRAVRVRLKVLLSFPFRLFFIYFSSFNRFIIIQIVY